MHRNTTVPPAPPAPANAAAARDPLSRGRRLVRTVLAASLLAALAVSLAPQARAQQPAPVTEDATPGIILSVNGIDARKMSTGKRVRNVAVADPTRVQVVVTSPTEVRIVGISPGISRVTLTDEDGRRDVFDVLVVTFDIRQLE